MYTDQIIVADVQLKGKGRHGTNWGSTGKQILFSFAIKNKINYLNVCDQICHTFNKFDIKTYVKWPNDIFLSLNNKKICGVLIEEINDYSIVGIGINVKGTIYNNIYENLDKNIENMEFINKFFENDKLEIIQHKSYLKLPNYVIYDGVNYKVEGIADEKLLIEDKEGNKQKIDDRYSLNMDTCELILKN